jgi:alkanesulfonate monooxygenase SsuD/methylene tetrahydromethanopterin reductase-like flavin-dependent oxidoreductase (luciferase family)
MPGGWHFPIFRGFSARQKDHAMKFGLFSSAQANSNDLPPETGQGFRDYLDFNVEAEALGFQSSFLVEHHFTGWNQVSATLMLLMAAAMRTKTLRLGSAVMVLPWHNPVLLAEQVATLDLISGGRLDLGIGKGYRHSEFKGFAIAPEEAEARFEEAVAVMTRAWTTRQRFSHHGRFWHFEDIVVEPPPAQEPYPPLWVAAGSEQSIRRAAARGFNLILDQYASTGQIAERIGFYKAERKDLASTRCRWRWRASFTSPTTRPTSKPRSSARPPIPSAPSMCRASPRAKAARMCSPMPTRPAAPRRMRCSARRMRSAPISRPCKKPA